MLDIKLIRENPEKINELLKRRNPDLSIDTIIAIDADRRKVQAQADELRAKRKSESQKIGMMKMAIPLELLFRMVKRLKILRINLVLMYKI